MGIFYLEIGDEPSESLCVTIRGPTNHDVMGVCYGLPYQKEIADKIFFQQLEDSRSGCAFHGQLKPS